MSAVARDHVALRGMSVVRTLLLLVAFPMRLDRVYRTAIGQRVFEYF